MTIQRWDLLLEWMTHVGSGAWAGFREAVAELANDGCDQDDARLFRTLRVTLSDLGHADFFVGGSRRWQVRRPALVGLAGRDKHLFVGGRTRALLERLVGALGACTTVQVVETMDGVSRVHVTGDPHLVREAAAAIDVEYVPDAAVSIAARLPSVRASMIGAPAAQEPINWAVRSWSFRDEAWVDGRLERTAREYANRHGVRRYMVHTGRGDLREVEKRASLYCAALVKGARIIRYEHSDRSLRVPYWAPLPELHARAACLASGRLGRVSGGEIVFEDVPPQVASTLMVGLGQGFPMPEAER